MIIRPNPLEPFRVLYDLPPKTWLVINIGGRGGGKSYEVSKFITLQAVLRNKRCAVLRDEQTTIAQSILHEIKQRYNDLNEKTGGVVASKFDMQEKGLKRRVTNTMAIFPKGFKTSQNGKKAGLKSIADVDIAVVEEFEDINDEGKFNTFADSIRKENALIIINSNVPSRHHWFVKRYFTLEQSEYPGYYRLKPKTIPGVVYIFSDFTSNPHLSDITISRYRAYGDPSSPMYDLNHWCTDILGLVSEGARGRIYPGAKSITDAEFEALPYPAYYGLDFGYSDDPVALVKLKDHNNKLYCRERIYLPGLTNPALARRMKEVGVKPSDTIFADSAEPKSIRELQDLGFPNVVPALKGPDSVLSGIRTLQAMELYATESSSNWWHENQEYKWKDNGSGGLTDEPTGPDHIFDATKYGYVTKKRRGLAVSSIRRLN